MRIKVLRLLAVTLYRLDNTLLNRIVASLAWALVTIILWTVFRLRAIGRRNIPGEGPLLLVANHSSHLDGPAIIAAILRLPSRIFFIVARDYFCPDKIWEYLCLKAFHLIGVNRNTQGPATANGVRSVLKFLRAKCFLVVFPEGTRSRTGELGPFDEDVARVALITGATIVPVAILGTFAAMPPDRKWPRLRPVTVVFGEPIVTTKLSPDDKKPTPAELSAEIRQRIFTLLESHR